MEHTIDAQGKSIGRVASEVAHVLMGKHAPSFEKRCVADVSVKIINSALLNISPKKILQKTYTRYSGYPGGLKTETLGRVILKKGHREVLRKAVYGMLPGNKLRSKRMKNLIIE
ncbi:50S ribosomal protein L13 [Candidatus Kaiserbacteria bacterium]|nr:50S ribosomal protein L13 [Candidatus Kaiserbacteria bacterium]